MFLGYIIYFTYGIKNAVEGKLLKEERKFAKTKEIIESEKY